MPIESDSIKPNDPKFDLLRGAIWAVGTRWSSKVIGLISTSILARILLPQDYGVVSMAFLVVGLVETFLNTGTGAALVRLGKTATTDQINSAWTLRGLQGCAVGLALAAISPFAAVYFNEPRVLGVLLAVSVCQALLGFSNMGMALAYRDLQFFVEFKQSLLTKIVSVAVTLVAAFYFRDYRGLVAGIVAGFIAEWFLSFYLHPYRPRWCTSKIPEIWAISKWLMITGIGSFFLHRSDQLIAGRLSSTAQYGTYVVGMDIGQLAAGELGPSLTRPLYPILVTLKEDWDRAKRATLKTLASVNSVTLPLGFGLAAVSNEATLVLLGKQWHAAIPFVAGFAIIGSIQYLTVPLSTLLNVAGHVRVQSRIVWIEFLSFIFLAIIFVWEYHLIGLVFARIGSSLLQSTLMLFAAQKHVQLSFFSSLRSLVRPLMSSILMYYFLTFAEFNFGSMLINLIGNILIGAFVYIFLLTVSWVLVRCPEGIESTVFGYLIKRF